MLSNLIKAGKGKALISLSFLVLIVIFFISLNTGSFPISFKEIIEILSTGATDTMKGKVLLRLRLPRIMMAIIVGMLLGSSGGVMQTLFRNPIADPYIMGISASATFGAVVAYFLKLPESFYGIMGSIFSFIVATVIFKLSENRRPGGGLSTLLVVGIAISALIRALISLSMYIMGEDSFRIILWTMGYLGRGSWREVGILIVPLLSALFYFFKHRYHLDALLLEEEEAHSLGIRVKKFRKEVLVITTFMIGFSVAFSGMIGFVGLIIPHMVRSIFGNANSRVIPLSAFYGGIFLLICDTLARGISPSMEIPIGIITAIFGAPFFLYLSFKMRRRGV